MKNKNRCKIWQLKGLPASGKSTWAKEQVLASGGNKKRICKDDLRTMLDNGKYSKGNEKFILHARNALILAAFTEGKSVIVDDTNLDPKHEEVLKALVEIAKERNIKVDFEIKDFKVPIKECIKKDKERENSVGEDVIVNMARRYMPEQYKEEFQYIPDKTKPKAVIFDIDGTLADNSHRSPYDETKVSEDGYIEPVWNALKMYHKSGYKILFISGRSEECIVDTLDWLKKKHPESFESCILDNLLMRTVEEKENRISDIIVKERIFNGIKDDYCIEAVYDDRDRVVEMWRSKGLQCFQANKGDF